jgi:hypothetical protein
LRGCSNPCGQGLSGAILQRSSMLCRLSCKHTVLLQFCPVCHVVWFCGVAALLSFGVGRVCPVSVLLPLIAECVNPCNTGHTASGCVHPPGASREHAIPVAAGSSHAGRAPHVVLGRPQTHTRSSHRAIAVAGRLLKEGWPPRTPRLVLMGVCVCAPWCSMCPLCHAIVGVWLCPGPLPCGAPGCGRQPQVEAPAQGGCTQGWQSIALQSWCRLLQCCWVRVVVLQVRLLWSSAPAENAAVHRRCGCVSSTSVVCWLCWIAVVERRWGPNASLCNALLCLAIWSPADPLRTPNKQGILQFACSLWRSEQQLGRGCASPAAAAAAFQVWERSETACVLHTWSCCCHGVRRLVRCVMHASKPCCQTAGCTSSCLLQLWYLVVWWCRVVGTHFGCGTLIMWGTVEGTGWGGTGAFLGNTHQTRPRTLAVVVAELLGTQAQCLQVCTRCGRFGLACSSANAADTVQLCSLVGAPVGGEGCVLATLLRKGQGRLSWPAACVSVSSGGIWWKPALLLLQRHTPNQRHWRLVQQPSQHVAAWCAAGCSTVAAHRCALALWGISTGVSHCVLALAPQTECACLDVGMAMA